MIQRASERAVARMAPRSPTSSRSPPTAPRPARSRPRHLLLFQSRPPLRPRELLRRRGRCRRRRRARHRHDRRRGRRVSRPPCAPPSRAHLPRRPHQPRRPPGAHRAARRASSTPSRASASPARSSRWQATPKQLVTRLRRFTELPIAVGFGISNAEHFAAVGEFADAAVIGSALVAH